MSDQSERLNFGALVQGCVEWVLIDPSYILDEKPESQAVAYVVVGRVFQYVLRKDDSALEALFGSEVFDPRIAKESLAWIIVKMDGGSDVRERCAVISQRLDSQ